MMESILLVDDDKDFVEATKALLEGAGYRVRTASNGTEALRQAIQEKPDLILLDVMLTERTEGFFVLQEIRRNSQLHEVPVIVVSSIYTECPGFRVTAEKDWLPADLFLPKPINPSRLLEEVGRLIGHSKKEENP